MTSTLERIFRVIVFTTVVVVLGLTFFTVLMLVRDSNPPDVVIAPPNPTRTPLPLDSTPDTPIPAGATDIILTPVTPPPTATASPAGVALVSETALTSGSDNSAATPIPVGDPATANQTGLIEDIRYLDTLGTQQINRLSAGFYPSNNIVQAKYSVARYEIRLLTRNEFNLLIPIRATLFVPQVDAPQTFPVFVYGAGTTGIGNDCAPLDERLRGRNWGQYRTHMFTYAAQGYIAILPHWEGYDDLGKTHPYFVAQLEGYVMLDATRAVYNFFENPPVEDIIARPAAAVFFGGYSEGGHGAFAGHDLAASYAPELPIRGIIGHATAPDVEALMRERPALAPYIVYAYRDYYGGDLIDPETVFLPQWIPTLDLDATTKCVDEVYQYYPDDPTKIYKRDFLNALFTEDLGEMYPAFKAKLDENYVGWSSDTRVPVLMLHGADDDIVTPKTAERFAGRLCALGRHVNYIRYSGVNHFITRQHSFVDTLNWMQAVLQGHPPPSNCANASN